MGNVAIMTDSNSGITQSLAKELGIYVLPMPFYIDGQLYYEDITLSQEEFYHKLEHDAEISTSMPATGDVMDMWDKLLKDYDEVVHIPMSSGLSTTCFALGLEKGMDLVNSLPDVQAVFITDDYQLHYSENFDEEITLSQ